jgi:hypothetical protein
MNTVNEQQLRSFGFTVGGIFAVIGVWPVVIHQEDLRSWALYPAAALLAAGIVFPKSLLWIHKGWMLLGHCLGWINTRIILGLVFYGVVTPIGMVRGWLGKDPMGRNLRPELDSYRIPREARPPSHMKRQY